MYCGRHCHGIEFKGKHQCKICFYQSKLSQRARFHHDAVIIDMDNVTGYIYYYSKELDEYAIVTDYNDDIFTREELIVLDDIRTKSSCDKLHSMKLYKTRKIKFKKYKIGKTYVRGNNVNCEIYTLINKDRADIHHFKSHLGALSFFLLKDCHRESSLNKAKEELHQIITKTI